MYSPAGALDRRLPDVEGVVDGPILLTVGEHPRVEEVVGHVRGRARGAVGVTLGRAGGKGAVNLNLNV